MTGSCSGEEVKIKYRLKVNLFDQTRINKPVTYVLLLNIRSPSKIPLPLPLRKVETK